MIYLDYNATTPIDPLVNKEIFKVNAEVYGNPSSPHIHGVEAEKVLVSSIQGIQSVLNTPNRNNKLFDKELIFTSGATEAINMIFYSIGNRYRSGHLIIPENEHKAVLECARDLENRGFEISYIPIKKDGNIDYEVLQDSIQKDTIMICCMWVNNETGIINDIERLSELAKRRNIKFFVDATQAIGKIDIDLSHISVDYLVCSAHKIYGPNGVGLVFQNLNDASNYLLKFIQGGGQQNDLRGGTIPISLIAGFSKAMTLVSDNYEERDRIKRLKDKLEIGLTDIIGIKSNVSAKNQIFNTINLSFEGIDTENLLLKCKEISFTSGSACTSETKDLSHVLSSMGLAEEVINSSVRFSLGRFSSESDITNAISIIGKKYKELTTAFDTI